MKMVPTAACDLEHLRCSLDPEQQWMANVEVEGRRRDKRVSKGRRFESNRVFGLCFFNDIVTCGW